MTQPFSLGISYLPRRQGFLAWEAFDRGAAREELAQIASFGVDRVRILPRWEDLQPRPDRIAPAVLRSLEQLLDLAHALGLRVVVPLFAGAFGSALQLPAWATAAELSSAVDPSARLGPRLRTDLRARRTLLYGNSWHTLAVHDFWSDPAQRTAQHYLIEEVVGYFAAHPAVDCWQLGLDLERIRRPPAALAEQWLAETSNRLRQRGARQLLYALPSPLLARPDTLRPERLARYCDLPAINLWPALGLRDQQPWQPQLLRMLYRLAAELAGRPLTVTGIGLPSTAQPQQAGWYTEQRFGVRAALYVANEEQQAEFVATALAGLHADGASGVWLAAYADYPAALWRLPPLDQAIGERGLGLVRADGSEKPAAQALREFARRLAANHLPAPQPHSYGIDPDRYWRKPAEGMRAIWQELQR